MAQSRIEFAPDGCAQLAAYLADDLVAPTPRCGSAVERVVAVVGHPALGKSTLSGRLCRMLQRQGVGAVHVPLDGFLKPRHLRIPPGLPGSHREAWRFGDAVTTLRMLIVEGSRVELPLYDHCAGRCTADPAVVSPAPVVVLDGVLAAFPEIAAFVDVGVFMYSDEATLRALREEVDARERGCTPDEARAKWAAEFPVFCRNVAPFKAQCQLWIHVNRSRELRLEFPSGEPVGEHRRVSVADLLPSHRIGVTCGLADHEALVSAS